MDPATPKFPMQAHALPPGIPAGSFAGVDTAREKYRGVRTCIWIFFWLLIIEGALRKWVVPGLANPLIVVKDPVVVMAYLLALKEARFPRSGFVTFIIVLGFVTFAVAVACFMAGFTRGNFLVAAYGARTNFLYFPFIFLMADALGREDLKKMGKWLLVIAVPMAVPGRGTVWRWTGGMGEQGHGGGGGRADARRRRVGDVDKTRAAGLFSFNTGLATFLSLAAAFLVNHFLRGKVYGKYLAMAASVAVAGSAMLSASRTTTLSVVVGGSRCLLRVDSAEVFQGLDVAGVCRAHYGVGVSSSRTLGQGYGCSASGLSQRRDSRWE